jgi:hypothetical protein
MRRLGFLEHFAVEEQKVPHPHQDWVPPSYISTLTRLTPAASAPGLGPPLSHRDWAHPCHICTGMGLTPAASAPGWGSPLPHLHRDGAHRALCRAANWKAPQPADLVCLLE